MNKTSSELNEPIEVAYRTRGAAWKRKSFKTQAAYEKWVGQLEDGIEIMVQERLSRGGTETHKWGT
jgi:hypothetical protein